jgi:hypothetical protein
MKKILADFIVDMETDRVRCRHCGLPCRSVRLSEFRAYVCSNLGCRNKVEVRKLPDGDWKVYEMGAIWGEEPVQEFLGKFVREILLPRGNTPSQS